MYTQTTHAAVFSPDASLVRLNNVTTDRQTQSAATGRTGTAPLDPVEALEQVLQLISLESRTGIIQAEHGRLTSALDLSDEQSAELLAFFQSMDHERRALREQMIQEMAPQICAHRADTEAELARILSREQLALMEELKANRQQRGQGKRQNRNTRMDWQGMPNIDCSN